MHQEPPFDQDTYPHRPDPANQHSERQSGKGQDWDPPPPPPFQHPGAEYHPALGYTAAVHRDLAVEGAPAGNPDGGSGGGATTAVAIRRVDSIEALLDALGPEAAADDSSRPGIQSRVFSPVEEGAEFEWVEGVPKHRDGFHAPGESAEEAAVGSEEEETAKVNPHMSFMSFLKPAA